MFRKILIANRGAIACRIERTLRRMGIASVAVYSTADSNSLHVFEADEAVEIGPAPAAQSYLSFDAIFRAAEQTGAEAIHPGYGFLSENVQFARECEARGIRFIGPEPKHIEAFALKHAARETARGCGVPLLPGTGLLKDLEDALEQAERLKYPVMLKSSGGGGGGIGMRVCHSPAHWTASPCTDYEKPFVFLLFGQDKALLVDTGSRNGNLAPTLEHTVKNWLARNHRPSISLIVVHSHPHEDHVWGDKEVQAMHDPAILVTLIPTELEATKHFYGIEHWPDDIGHVDLGGRVIDLIPIPGHSDVSVALYDRNTAVLLAGDSLYPGRLYVADFPAFQASTERLIRFTAGKPVAQILGNHIE